MQIPCKTVSPQIMYFLVVFSSLLATSIAVPVSSDEKKWLLDTLLSLRQELRHNPAPTYTPPQWGAPGPAPIPTPTHWIPADNYGYQVPSLGLPSDQPEVHNSKRNYHLGRLSAFGLLCCNHPPTRPPRMKRPNSQDTRWRTLVQLLNSFNDRTIDTVPEGTDSDDQSEDIDRPFGSYFDADEDTHPAEVQRRGVTERPEFQHDLDISPGDFL